MGAWLGDANAGVLINERVPAYRDEQWPRNVRVVILGHFGARESMLTVVDHTSRSPAQVCKIQRQTPTALQ